MSDSKQRNALDQIRRAKTLGTYAFIVITLGVIGCVILRDLGHLTPGVYGLVLTVWIFAGLTTVGLWCTVYVCEWDARYARRAEQMGEKVDQLSEVVMVAEWLSAMEDEKYRIHRTRRN